MNGYGNGNQGVGVIGRIPAQQERIDTGFQAEVSRPIVKSFVAIAFAVIALACVVFSLIIIGPIVGVVAVLLIMAAAVYWFGAWIGAADESTDELRNGKRAATIALVGIAVIVAVMWLFNGMKAIESIWPPVIIEWAAWIKFCAIIVFGLIAAVMGMMAFSFFVNAYNPAAFQPYQARREGSTWYLPTGRAIEMQDGNGDDAAADRLADVRAMIESLQQEPKKRIVRETPIIIEGNRMVGIAKQISAQMVTSDDPQIARVIEDMQPDQAQEQAEHPVLLDEDGHLSICMEQNSHKSTPVKLELARKFVGLMCLTERVSIQELRRAGLTPAKQDTVKRVMVYAGIATPADGATRTTVKIAMTTDEALAQFDYVFGAGKVGG